MLNIVHLSVWNFNQKAVGLIASYVNVEIENDSENWLSVNPKIFHY